MCFRISVVFMLALFGVTGCTSPPDKATENPPSILLVTIDALRADHVGWVGHGRPTTPFLDQLRQSGTSFSRASSVSSWTAPALASLVTGVYPPSHGVVHGSGLDAQGLPDAQEALPDSLVLFPEKLQTMGYRTFGIVANLHGHDDFGFGRGFDRYRCVGFSEADRVHEVLLEWRAEIVNTDQPVFLWLHYFDPHWPYHVRQPWAHEFVGPEPKEALASIEKLVEKWPAMPRAVGKDLGGALESARELYDVEIAYTDHMIETAFSVIPELDSWFTLITADHGEEFLDHGELGHGMNLFAETVQIPMVIRSGQPGAPRTVEAPVSLVDIAPTLLVAAGGQAPETWHGRALIDGNWNVHRDLEDDRVVLSFLDRGEDRRHRIAMIAGGYKLITGADFENVWLYDIKNDPFERQNLAPLETQKVREMIAELSRRIGAMPSVEGKVPKVTLSDEQIRQLEAIGYIEARD